MSPAGGAYLNLKGGYAYPEALKKSAQSGLVDLPNHATYKVEFQPAKKRALVHREHVEQEDQPPRKWTETWALDGGVFVEPPKPAASGSP